jgi:hypothetical protein
MVRQSVLAVLLAVTATYCVHAHAEDITGDYTVEGTDAEGGGPYTGTLTIQKKGDVYTMIWVIAEKKAIGAGIITDNVLSACWKEGADIGLCSYKISAGKLTGQWAELKTDGKVYKETATKK